MRREFDAVTVWAEPPTGLPTRGHWPGSVGSPVPRLRTIAFVALIVVLTDVTWDGKSLRISIGLPGRRRIVQLVFP